MSRGYDGPEIDDFRDSCWEREPYSSYRVSNRGRGNDSQTRANIKLKLEKLREAESRSDQPIAQSRDGLESNRPTLSRDDRQIAILKERDREKYAERGRSYSLRIGS